MRLHGHGLRTVRARYGRPARVAAAAVLAFSFALALWPCCELLAGAVAPEDLTGDSRGHRHGGEAPPDAGHAPGPCAWMDANDVALPEIAPVARTGPHLLHSAVLPLGPTAVDAILPRASFSRGPPGPRYLVFHRLLL